MKTIRYLLIILVVTIANASVCAQHNPLAEVELPFRSTSALYSSGSSLPIAALTGVVAESAAPSAEFMGKKYDSWPQQAKMDDNPFGGQTIDDVNNPLQPGTPITDGVWLLLLMAGGYTICRRQMLQRGGMRWCRYVNGVRG